MTNLVYNSAANGIAQLKKSQHSNVIYNLAKGFGTMRQDGSDSQFPTQRMPMGLVEHMASFCCRKVL